MIKFILLSTVVAVVAAHGAGPAKCPYLMAKYPFDETKFQGDWYLVAGMPIMSDKLSRCGKFHYRSQVEGPNHMSLKYTAMDHEHKPVAIESRFTPYSGKTDKMAAIFMGVWRREGTQHWSDVFKQSVVATDYENYAVFVACQQRYDEKAQKFGRYMFAEIWGRHKTLGKETLDVLKNVLSGYDIDPKQIHTADHENCS